MFSRQHSGVKKSQNLKNFDPKKIVFVTNLFFQKWRKKTGRWSSTGNILPPEFDALLQKNWIVRQKFKISNSLWTSIIWRRAFCEAILKQITTNVSDSQFDSHRNMKSLSLTVIPCLVLSLVRNPKTKRVRSQSWPHVHSPIRWDRVHMKHGWQK